MTMMVKNKESFIYGAKMSVQRSYVARKQPDGIVINIRMVVYNVIS